MFLGSLRNANSWYFFYPQILCNQIPWLCSCEVTGNLSTCPSSQPSTLSWCSFRAAEYLDVIGVCEKHCDAVDAHAPATRGGQPVLQGGAEGFIYEHGLIVTSGLGLEDRTTCTVTLFQAACSGVWVSMWKPSEAFPSQHCSGHLVLAGNWLPRNSRMEPFLSKTWRSGLMNPTPEHMRASLPSGKPSTAWGSASPVQLIFRDWWCPQCPSHFLNHPSVAALVQPACGCFVLPPPGHLNKHTI